MSDMELLQVSLAKLADEVIEAVEKAEASINQEELEDFRKELKDWMNPEAVGTRFPLYNRTLYGHDVECQKCGNPSLLVDEWPPNYGSGSFGGAICRSTSALKLICSHCKLHFTVLLSSVTEYETNMTKKKVTYNDAVPLVEFEGKLLTPHDVSGEEYKKKYGDYPMEVYG